MNNKLISMTVLLCSLSCAGCNNMSRQDFGTVSGGVAGGLLGSTVGRGGGQVLAIAAGTLAGAFIGGSIGKSMDDTDVLKMRYALNNPIGQSSAWHNHHTGASYRVTPLREVHVGHDYCREYRSTAYIAGRKQQIYGRACRQADGSWRVVR